ncbi:O-antigen ligase family protein [bacterium]|nr:O-antigen ligase family protein [bacterium]
MLAILGLLWLIICLVAFPWPFSFFVFSAFFSVFLLCYSPRYFFLFLLVFFPLYHGLGIEWEFRLGKFVFNGDGLLKLVYLVLLIGRFFSKRSSSHLSLRRTIFGSALLYFFLLALFRLYPHFYQQGISLILSFGLYLGIYLLAWEEFRTPERRENIIHASLIAILLNLGLAVYQFFLYSGQDIAFWKDHFKAFFSHAGSFSTFLVITLPFWFVQFRTFLLLGFLLALGGVFFSYTRSAWATSVAFLLNLGIFLRRKIAWIILPVLVGGLLFFKPTSSLLPWRGGKEAVATFRVRVAMWREIVSQLRREDWIWGKGSGYSGAHIASDPRFSLGSHFTPHSSWIEALVDWGILGIGGLLFLSAKLIHLFWLAKNPLAKIIALHGLAILVFQGGVLSLFFSPEVFIYWWVLLAYAEAIRGEK